MHVRLTAKRPLAIAIKHMGAFLWDDPYQDQWSEITRIMVDQMNQWIHSGQGFISSFDLPWSERSRDHWSWSGSSQRNAPMESSISSLQWSRRSTLGSICRYMWCQLPIFTRNMKLVSTNDNQKVTRDKTICSSQILYHEAFKRR